MVDLPNRKSSEIVSNGKRLLNRGEAQEICSAERRYGLPANDGLSPTYRSRRVQHH